MSAVSNATETPKTRQRLVLAVIAIAGAGYLGHAAWFGAHYVETDNAQIGSDIAPISGRISGFVMTVPVRENQRVKAGELLVTLDDRDAKARLAQAEAELLSAMTITGSQDVSTLTSATANLTETNATLTTGGTLVVSDPDATDATVVALIVCAEFFAESLKAIGAIDTLLHSASNAGIGSGLMTLVMVGLIVVASVIMGSGNAAFLSFSTLAPAVAAKFGVPAVTMLLPMQLASSIGRTVSPIAAVLIACSGIAKISPFVLVKRTSVPMAGALLTALLLNYLLFMK